MKTVFWRLILAAYLGFLVGSLFATIGQPPTACEPITEWGAVKVLTILLAIAWLGFAAGRESLEPSR